MAIITTAQDLKKQLLQNLGLSSKKEEDLFFNPKIINHENDFKIDGLEIAKKRILKAIKNQELIIVYGDYDADGICGTAILYLGLTLMGAKVLPYIPHREKEGYGLSEMGLKTIKEKGASLVITVDNGIVAIEQAKFAKSLGLDLIITDHHVTQSEKPQALAIIHSTKMCGAAVGWVLIRYLIGSKKASELLDLVAIATIADMVPLLGVNRALVAEGLKSLNETKRVGLLALIKSAGIFLGEINAFQVGYILAPRLNAKGRLEHAMDALRLLCTKDKIKAQSLARLLDQTNDQKKKLVDQAVAQAKQMISISHPQGGIKNKVLVLCSKDWIPGIVGLVAGRICEEYHIPTIAIAIGENEAKGSARSVKGVDIIETIRQCSNFLIDVGGHPQAAGFTIKTDKIEILQTKLEEIMQSVTITEKKQFEVGGVVDITKIDLGWIKILNQFEPFGMNNPKPILASSSVILSNAKTVGLGQHLKFKASDLEAIAFSKGDLAGQIKNNQQADLIFYLELNKFNGSQTPQLKVLDIQLT